MTKDLKVRIRQIRNESLPSSDEIVQKAFKRLNLTKWSLSNPTGKKPEEIINEFNKYLKDVFKETLNVLESLEEKVYEKIFKELCKMRSKKIEQISRSVKSTEFTYKVLKELYPDLWHIFLSRSQSRKTRGGKDFECQIKYLLELADIPFESQVQKYHIDLLLPNSQLFRKDKTRAVLLSLKRTLRERWREVVEELHRVGCPNIYLLTVDSRISKEKVQHIARHNIHLVVWDEVKEKEYTENAMVLGYTELMKRILFFKQSWKNL